MKTLCILGSTGSIGTQTLDVVRQHPDEFEVYAITAQNSVDTLIEQAREFHPEVVVITNPRHYDKLASALEDLPIKVFTGDEALCDVVQMEPVDVVVTAMVGFSGLKPTISAIKAHKLIALANKETLVVAGQLMTQLAIDNHAPILPVDSEHSAIFQCLAGERSPISKILLTASGGPFRTFSREAMATVTAAQALKHPNWQMGAKITIDSATMMNKGFEMIEAKWLFGVSEKQIEVVVHPESIVHSAVEFEDGAVKAQLGVPDMRLPIQYALTYPDRLPLEGDRLDLFALKNLTFERPDMEKFPCLRLAFEAIGKGGNMPCVLNAANEVANLAFREGKITYPAISEMLEKALQTTDFIKTPTLDDLIETDRIVREKLNS